MSRMFGWCEKLTSLDVSNFKTGKVTNMSLMFPGCYSLKSIDLSEFDTRNVTDMSSMFLNSSALTEILVGPNWTTENATTTNMFYGCGVSEVTLKATE